LLLTLIGAPITQWLLQVSASFLRYFTIFFRFEPIVEKFDRSAQDTLPDRMALDLYLFSPLIVATGDDLSLIRGRKRSNDFV
jgi:hypothetical protein